MYSIRVMLCLIVSLLAQYALAVTDIYQNQQDLYYINASPDAAVRMDPKPTATILEHLKKGTVVTKINKYADNGYLLVETKVGDQGWIALHNLSKLANLSKYADDGKTAETVAQSNEVNATNTTNATVRSAADPSTAWKFNPSNHIENLADLSPQAQMKIQDLEQENAVLASNNNRIWFVAGGLVFFAGLLTGIIVGRSSKRRTHW